MWNLNNNEEKKMIIQVENSMNNTFIMGFIIIFISFQSILWK
jgi:hypothetical protein